MRIAGWFNPYMRIKRLTGKNQMNQIVNILISALGIPRRDQATNDLNSRGKAPMVELCTAALAQVVGGDGEDTGPRGGWKAVAISAE